MIAAAADHDFGIEATLMFSYMSDPGYDGAMDLLYAEDLRKVSPSLSHLGPNDRADQNARRASNVP